MKNITIIIFITLITLLNQAQAQDRKITITIGLSEFTASLNDNETVDAFIAMLPMTINMTEMGGYEKYHYLSQNLPGSASNVGTIYEGDLMIWSGNCLVLFYTTRPTSYSYIKLGRIDNTEELRQAVGTGNVEITFELKNLDPEEPDPEDPTVGIENPENKGKSYLVYPNPVHDHIHILGEFQRSSLYTINGTLIMQSEEKIISTEQLPSGVYMLKIDTKNGKTVTRKIIKR